MTLTLGKGPFGNTPAGSFNFDAPREGVEYLEDIPMWVRGRLGGETVVDSKRTKFLHRHGRLPIWVFPEEDVQTDLIPDDQLERVREGLVHVQFWALDQWLEEEEEVIGHPRDQYHRLDVRETSRHVRVSVDGEMVAESTRTKVLFECGLPPRWYFPEEDVRTELLEPTDSSSICAYKGIASYWSAAGEEDVVWTYRDPELDAQPVKDMLAFYNERVDVEVDGELEERPQTQWSPKR